MRYEFLSEEKLSDIVGGDVKSANKFLNVVSYGSAGFACGAYAPACVPAFALYGYVFG